MNIESIVYLLRKTSLTLLDIGELTPGQFSEMLTELYYQEAVDEYRRQHSIASIMAAIYNTIPRKRGSKILKASDFLGGDIPERNPKPQDSLDEMAKKRDIALPTKELRDR